jgi:hypothetical protein
MPRSLRKLNVPQSTQRKSFIRSHFALCISTALLIAYPLCAAVQAESAPIGLHTYESELQRYSSLIEQEKDDPAQIAALRKTLPSGWTIENGGATFHVSSEPIDSALIDLQTHPADPGQIARDVEFRLSEMRQSAIDMESAATDSAPNAQAEAKRILQAREFQTAKAPSRLEEIEDEITRRITDWLARLFSHLHISQRMGNVLAYSVIGLAFIALAYWIYRTLSQKEDRPQLPVASAEVIVSDAREWVRDALAAAERGDYREAVHCAYWASIARLEDLKLLKRDRARTPRESLRLLDAHPNEQSSLRNLTGNFELIWYGDRPASSAEWSEAKNLLEKFGCLAASTAPTANS